MPVFQTQFSTTQSKSRAHRRGLTLIEIMIALTMTLIVLGAMMSAFRYASEKMQLGRGVMEMANRLRSAEELLRNDLANLTLDPRPYSESTSPSGFLEIIEGADNDALDFGAAMTAGNNYLGDIDDSIGMTVRSADGRKFRGTVLGSVQESTIAEVWYFTTLNDLATSSIAATDAETVEIEDSIRLHRRALLIRPDFNAVSTSGTGLVSINGTLEGLSSGDVDDFVANNDISVSVVADSVSTFRIVANTLADLAIRKNRFAHTIDPFSTTTPPAHLFPNSPTAVLTLSRLKTDGEDILLSDVAGFDVRVYSPNAEVQTVGGLLVQPGDPGYGAGGSTVLGDIGGFVDLGYKGTTTETEWFANNPTPGSQLAGGGSSVYDTWSPSYEHDGINQDGDVVSGTTTPLVDEGTNGVNDLPGGTAAPDDDAERETRPPYPYPVRGIQISTRLIEKTTQQVHQSSIVQSYVPE